MARRKSPEMSAYLWQCPVNWNIVTMYTHGRQFQQFLGFIFMYIIRNLLDHDFHDMSRRSFRRLLELQSCLF
jgi:hypothetical protein